MKARVIEKDGKWIVYINVNGKRKQAIAPDKRAAEGTVRDINKRILDGSFNLVEPERIKTFHEYADIYLAHCTIKPSTKSDYISLLKCHILPKFGKIQIDKISRLDVKNFLRDKLQSGLTTSTVNHIKACVSNVFDAAFDDDSIPKNPAYNMRRIAGTSQESHTSAVKPRFLTKDELSSLLDTFMKYRPEHYPLCLLLARTGMRIGEAVALQWTDFDFEKRTIKVRRAKARSIIDTPKSGKGRNVDMSSQLCEVMKQLRMDSVSGSIRTGKRSKWVFPGKISETMDATAWRRRVFDIMVRKAGLEKMRVHDLRHTYASLALAGGQPLIWIQHQLGHHSIQITADTYSHLIPDADRSAVDKMDDVRKTDVEPLWKYK